MAAASASAPRHPPPAESWIVDADAREVQRWRPEDARQEVLGESITWAPLKGVPPLTIDFVSVFGPDETDRTPAS